MHLLGGFWGMPPPIHQGKLDAVGLLLRPFWPKVELQSLVLPAVLCMCDSAYSGLLDVHMDTDCLAEMLVPFQLSEFQIHVKSVGLSCCSCIFVLGSLI